MGKAEEVSDRRKKLNDQQVAQIRWQYDYGRRPRFIAKEFGITVHHVWKIVNERVWKSGNKTATISPLKPAQ